MARRSSYVLLLQILERVSREPGISQYKLMRALDTKSKSFKPAIALLEKMGAIRTEIKGMGRNVKHLYYPTEFTWKALEESKVRGPPSGKTKNDPELPIFMKSKRLRVRAMIGDNEPGGNVPEQVLNEFLTDADIFAGVFSFLSAAIREKIIEPKMDEYEESACTLKYNLLFFIFGPDEIIPQKHIQAIDDIRNFFLIYEKELAGEQYKRILLAVTDYRSEVYSFYYGN